MGCDEPTSHEILAAVDAISIDEQMRLKVGTRPPKPSSSSDNELEQQAPLEQQAMENLPPDDEIVQWGATLLEECTPLAQLRYNLVPSRIPEELFWRRFLVELATKVFDNVLAQVNCSPTK